MYLQTRCPQRWRPKLDSYKIPVRLHKFQETLEDLVEKLEHEIGLIVAQAAQYPDREIDFARSWIPTMPSLDDCRRALQKVRANFTGQGWFNALVQSFNDAVALLATWKFWQSKYGKALIRLTLTLGMSMDFSPIFSCEVYISYFLAESTVRRIKICYDWTKTKIPSFDLDKKLNDLANYIHNLRDRLAPLNPDNGHALAAIANEAENDGAHCKFFPDFPPILMFVENRQNFRI